MLDDFSNLFRYEIWAKRRVLESLREAVPPAKAAELFAHILAGQEVWLAVCAARTVPRFPSGLAAPSRTAKQRSRAWNEAYIASLNDEALEKKIAYSNQHGHHWHHTPRQVLTHLALHSHYHRGQIASRLREAGLTPNNTHFIHYLRVGAGGSARR
jgi:uncharacterized damage-inducible protein DinB